MPDHTPTPVIILTGFLGAGKTTLLRRILAATDGPRYGVLVNDFGEINLDAELVQETGRDGVVALQNGCICCSIRDDLVDSIASVLDRPDPPERLVIEASGVSRPLQIAEALEAETLADRVALDGVYCLIDCGNFTDLDFAATELAMDQVFGSDLAILNKTDLASDPEITRIEQVLRNAQPRIRLFRTSDAVVPAELLAGMPDPVAHFAQPHHCSDPHCDHDHHNHDFRSWSWRGEGRFDSARLKKLLSGLPGGILRAKGVLRGENGERLRADLVGKRVTVIREDAPAPDRSALVFLGRDEAIEPDALSAAIDTCRDRETAQ